MPINYPGFNADPNIKNDFSGIGDILPNMLAGYKAGLIPQQMRMERQKQELANALNEQQIQHYKLTNQFLPQTTEADINYKNAQAQKALDPFLNGQFSGSAENAWKLGLLEQQAKIDPKKYKPLYQYVKNAMDLDKKNTESLINSRDMLSSTSLKRSASALGKENLELDDVIAGYRPNTNRTVPIDSSEEQEELAREYGGSITKKITTDFIQNKNANVENIEQTLSQIDPKVISQYNGLWGGVEKGLNAALSPFHGETKNYKNHQVQLTAVEFLRDQVRQFYQDSVDKSARDDLLHLLNPSSWFSNPEIAEEKFNMVQQILGKELNTYKEFAKGYKRSYKTKSSDSQSTKNISNKNKEKSNRADPWGVL